MLWSVELKGGPRRVNHAAVAIGHYIFSFGGYCSGEQQNKDKPIDIHVLNTKTYRWRRVIATNERSTHATTSTAQRFEPRSAGSNPPAADLMEVEEVEVAVEVGGAVPLFAPRPPDLDDSDDEEPEDSLPPPRGDVPYQRYGHTVCAFENKAYLWGGRNDEYGASAHLHEYDPATGVWQLVEPASHPPPARDGHSAVVIGKCMYVFGGFEEEAQRFSQETFVYNFATREWTMMQTRGVPPSWRDFHTAVGIAGKMYVFGGRSDEQGQHHSSNDVYENQLKVLDLATCKWSNAPVKIGVAPHGRRSHSAWVMHGRMYIFGGYHGSQEAHFNDMHMYDPATAEWREMRPFGKPPMRRRRQSTVVVGSKVFLFGGTMPMKSTSVDLGSGNLTDLDDLHVLECCPTLQTLAALAVIQCRDRRAPFYLPKGLRAMLDNMQRPNSISKAQGQLRQVVGG